MLSVPLGIDIKTGCVKDFLCILIFFSRSAFKTPIMPWVNGTPTIQRGPKSEHNTSGLYEPHAKQQRGDTITLDSGTDGYRVKQDTKLFPTWVTWLCKLWPICTSSCLCFFLPCHKVLRSYTNICLSDYMHLLPSSGCRPLETGTPMVARNRGHVGGSAKYSK